MSYSNIARRLAVFFIQGTAALSFDLLFSLILILQIRQRTSDGQNKKPDRVKGHRATTLLIIHENMYRGDLELFAGVEDFQILVFNTAWQQVLVEAFYGKNVKTVDYYNPRGNPPVELRQKQSRRYLESVLRRIFNYFEVDAVLSPNMRFVEDLDWSYVSEQLGVPSIVLYREGLNMYKRACQGLLTRQKKFGKFIGTHIVVANKSTKDIFVKSGFVTAENVTIGGIPRMDNLCQLIEMHNKLQQKPSERIEVEKVRILVLYFAPGKYQKGFADSDGVWRPAGIPIKLFEETMASIVSVAAKNPDIEILIKPKKDDESIKYFFELCKRRNLKISSIKNLRIDDSVNLHEYMMSSKVVCGLQSTSVLEAAIAGKEVVVPYFEEFRNSDWSDRFGYRDHLSAFSIPKDAVELEECLISGLSKQQSDAIMEYRRQLFLTWVSSPDGTATHTCAQIIKGVISKSGQR